MLTRLLPPPLPQLQTAAISSQRKEAALRSKRLRRDASVPGLASLSAEAPAQAEQAMPEAVPEDIERRLAEAVAALREAKPVGGKEHLQAVRSLRQLLSNCECLPFFMEESNPYRGKPGGYQVDTRCT